MRRRLLLGVLIVLAALVAAVGYVLNTERGLYWALALGQRVVPELQVKSAEGRLSGPLVLHDVSYASPSLRVHVQRLEFDWQPLRLFDASVSVERIAVQGVTVTRLPEEQPEAPQPSVQLPTIALPLDIRVGSARISDISFRPTPQAAALQIDTVDLSAALADRELRVHHLRVTSPRGRAGVAGTLGTTGNYPADLHLSWHTTIPTSGKAIAGEGTLRGDIDRLRIAQSLSGAFAGSIDASFTGLPDTPRWEGRASVQGLETTALRPSLPAMRITAQLHGGGAFERFSLQGGGRVEGTPVGTVDIDLAAQRLPQEIQISRLALVLPGGPTRVNATGALSFAPRPSLALQAQWRALQWPMHDARAVIASPEGSLRLSGWLDNYGGRLRAKLSRPEGPLGEWRVTAQGDSEGMSLQRISAQTLGGNIAGSGRLGWADGLSWKVRLDGKQLDPGKLLPEWKGNIRFAAQNEGDSSSGVLRTATRLEKIDGMLRGYQLAAEARVTTQGSTVSIANASLRQGPNRLHVSGSIGERWDLSWTLSADKLAALHPDASGTASAEGRISGPRNSPDVAATLTASRLRYGDYGAGTLRAKARLDRFGTAPSQLEADATNLTAAGQTVQSLHIGLQGTRSAHQLRVDADTDHGRARVELAGGLEGGTWKGDLQTAQLATKRFGHWHLKSAVAISAAADTVRASKACWVAERGSACLQGEWKSGGTLRATAEIEHFPLGLLAPIVPGDMGLQGEFEATADFAYGPREKHLQATLRLPPGSLQYRSEGEVAESFAYRAATLHVDTRGEDVVATLDFPFEELGRLDARVQLPGLWARDGGFATQPLDGQLSANLTDLSVAAAFLPDLYKPGGRVSLDVGLRGSVGKPQVEGSLKLVEAHADVPRLGLKLRAINVAVHNRDADTFVVEGSAQSGKGQLSLDGRFGIDVLQGGRASLHLSGENFTVADISDAHVEASPDLRVQAASRDLRVTGTVRIPQARITPGELPASSVSPSSDVVVVKGPGAESQEQSTEQQGRWQLHARIKLVLGDKVSFKGFGLSGDLSGGLTLIDEPGKPTLGEGEVAIQEGIYKFYGRELNIEEGRVLFAGGPVANPGIQARAVRTVDTVRAGVEISGDLKQPKVTLFSEPPMDESDVLSYIVLGRPIQAASQGEGEILYQAARKLGLAGGGLLAKKLRSTFGLDVLSIESSNTTNEPSLVIGKYLSPRIYLGYAVGLFEDVNVLQLRYQIDKNWSLQTETGTTSGGDILYTIEK